MSTLVQQQRSPTESTTPHRTGRSPWLVVALVVAVLAAAGLGIWVYADHQASTASSPATKVVSAWIDASNAHDLAAVQATMTDDAVWMRSPHGTPAEGPLTGSELVSNEKGSFDMGFRFEPLSGPTAASESQVGVVARVSLPKVGMADNKGVAVFTVRQTAGGPKISEIIWMGS